MKYLIADSGSTKTDWCFSDGENSIQFHSAGINPFFMTDKEILNEIDKVVVPKLDKLPDKIFFYGAGVRGNQQNRLQNIFLKVFKDTEVFAESDLLGAARALCGDEEGIACIMGTGANSCLYDGKKIVDNIPPLGFIQGDEGSGAVLGKKLLTMYLKRELSSNVEKKFIDQYGLDTASILKKVYQEAFPNRFLAGFSKFIHENLDDDKIYQMVYESFVEFLERNVFKYVGYHKMKIHFVGSIAYFFKDVLLKIFEEKSLNMGKIIRSPLMDLVDYHLGKKDICKK